MPPLRFDREEARRLYVDENMNYAQVGQRLGVTGKAIRNALAKLGVKAHAVSRRATKPRSLEDDRWETVRLRFPASLTALIDQEARKIEVSRAKYVRDIIETYFDERGVKVHKQKSQSKGWDLAGRNHGETTDSPEVG